MLVLNYAPLCEIKRRSLKPGVMELPENHVRVISLARLIFTEKLTLGAYQFRFLNE